MLVIIVTSVKLLFDLWPSFNLQIFEEKSLMCRLEEVSTHFEEIFKVYSMATLQLFLLRVATE